MADAVNQKGSLPVDSGSRLARWLWPPRCLLCRARGAGGLDLCDACTRGLPWLRHACRGCAIPLAPLGDLQRESASSRDSRNAEPGNGRDNSSALDANDDRDSRCGRCLQAPSPLTETRAACLYGAPLDRLLPRFKFHHDLAAGRLLAQLMIRALSPQPGDWPHSAALLPIPLHARRLRQRGYDQALELARPLGRALALPLLDHALYRTRDTRPQSRLEADQRQRNLKDAFSVRDDAALPSHVVLVDDVMTTGATLHAAAAALRQAGVARVDAWVCARVP